MGIQTSSFWSLTPHEWNALAGTWRQRLERMDIQFASIRKMLYDIHSKEDAPNYSIDHFRLMKKKEESEEDIARSIEEQMRFMAEI